MPKCPQRWFDHPNAPLVFPPSVWFQLFAWPFVAPHLFSAPAGGWIPGWMPGWQVPAQVFGLPIWPLVVIDDDDDDDVEIVAELLVVD